MFLKKSLKKNFKSWRFVVLAVLLLLVFYFIFLGPKAIFPQAAAPVFDPYWYACTSNDQCMPSTFIGAGGTGVCLSGWCQVCEADVECDSGESCIKGLCKQLIPGEGCGVGRCGVCDNNYSACQMAECKIDDFNREITSNPVGFFGMGECWEPGGTEDDKDADGLINDDEVVIYNTDSRRPDSDGGGINDGNEIARFRNPNDSNDDGFVTGSCDPSIGLFCGDPGSNCVGLGSGLSCIPSFRIKPPILITDFDADGCPDWFEYNRGYDAHNEASHPPFSDCRVVKNPPTGKVCSVNSNCPSADANLVMSWACGPEFLCVPSHLDRAICGNNVCEEENGEGETSCPDDCDLGSCGDGLCSFNESMLDSCPSDCPTLVAPVGCGDSICDITSGESGISCPIDCFSIGVPSPGPMPSPSPSPMPIPGGGAVCGDSICDTALGEGMFTCSADCVVCGDAVCASGFESSVSCPSDCAVASGDCGNGLCGVGEDSISCSLDCPSVSCNNDSVCDSGENVSNCSSDCGSAGVCGNWSCEVWSAENSTSCPQDCLNSTGDYCGDGSCSAFEKPTTCSLDC